MKLLLTGGTGFFGRALIRYLNHDYKTVEIYILSRNPGRFIAEYPHLNANDSVKFLKGDIQQRDSLPWDKSFTHVLHAATDSTIGPSLSPLKRYEQIVDGTRNILDLAVATGARRFLFTSSGAIYGPQPTDLAAIPEDYTGSPPLYATNTAYGQAKRTAEHICHLMGEEHELEIVIARCFAFIGADLPINAHFAVGNFIRDARSAREITVQGDGTSLRTYLDQHDLAHWLMTLLRHGKQGQTYNVGSNEVVSIAELAYLVRDVIAPNKPVRILGRAKIGTAGKRYIPDIRKIQKELGLSVRISLKEAISITETNHKQLEE